MQRTFGYSSSKSTSESDIEVILIGSKKQLKGNSEELSEPLYLVNILDGSSRKIPPFPYEVKYVSGVSYGCSVQFRKGIKSITAQEDAIYINSKASCPPSDVDPYLKLAQRPIFRYDLVSNTWETHLSRRGPPSTDYVFEMDKWLFMSWIGVRGDSTCISRYNLENQEFGSESELSIRNPSFVVVDKLIYAIGGCLVMKDDSAVSSAQEDESSLPSASCTLIPTVQVLNTTTNEWTQLAPLLETREKLLSCAFDGKIYVFDGRDHPISRRPQVYHIAENKWEWGPFLNRFYSHPATLVVVNNTLTFIDKSRFPVLQIERLLPGNDKWEVGEYVEVQSKFQIMDAQFFPGVAKIKPCRCLQPYS